MAEATVESRKPVFADLATTTGKDGSQGRTALAKQLAEFSSMVFGWSDDKAQGSLDMSAPREIEATIVSDNTTGGVQTSQDVISNPHSLIDNKAH